MICLAGDNITSNLPRKISGEVGIKFVGMIGSCILVLLPICPKSLRRSRIKFLRMLVLKLNGQKSLHAVVQKAIQGSFLSSEWKSKKSGADRRVYNLTDDGIKLLKEGLEMIKKRRPLADVLIQFYDEQFGGNDEQKS